MPRRARAPRLLALLLLGAVGLPLACDGRSPPQPFDALALPRPFLARLSIRVQHRPCEARGLRCGAPIAAPPATLTAALGAASERVRTASDGDALHTLALADLLWGELDGATLDRAIRSLDAARQLAAHREGVLVDLAAAYLLRAERDSSLEDLMQAAEAAGAAVALAPDDPAARFDHALALERLGLDEEARSAWESLAGAREADGWSREARARAARTRPATGRERARFLVMDTLLGRWGAAVLAGDDASARATLARVERAATTTDRDGTIAAFLAEITDADPVRRRALAGAHAELGAGRQAYERTAHDSALVHLRAALAQAPAGSLVHDVAMLYTGSTRLYLGDADGGRRLVERAAAAIDTVRFPALAGQARGMLASARLRAGAYQEALALYLAAAACFARAGEMEHLGAVQVFAAQTLTQLGDQRAAMRAMLAALRSLSASPSVWRHSLLLSLARASAAAGLTRTADAVHREDVRVAAQVPPGANLVEARLARARFLGETARRDAAMRDVDSAARVVLTLDTGATRRWFEADLRGARATLEAPGEAQLADLASVIAYYESTRNVVRLVPALAARARARLASGDSAGALGDLRAAIAAVEGERSLVAYGQARASFMDTVRELYDLAAGVELARGRDGEALALIERGRLALHRSGLPDRATAAGAAPPEHGVEYAVVGGQVVAWTFRGGNARAHRLPIRAEELSEAARRLRAAFGAGASERGVLPVLERLYDALVRPLEAELAGVGDELLVVADGEIAQLPLGALRDRRRGEYVVQRWALHFAPALERASPPRAARPSGRALVVADPAFDERAHRGYARLTGAGAEGREVAHLYAAAALVDAERATRAHVMRELPHAEVAHFAAHALLDEEDPAQSRLLLAGGDVTARDVTTLDLDGVRLVVLAACESSPSIAGRASALAGLAQAFLIAGANGVVGSLWQTDDASTRPLMVALHREYRATGDAARALHRAQLALLAAPDPRLRSPATWAAFVYVGR